MRPAQPQEIGADHEPRCEPAEAGEEGSPPLEGQELDAKSVREGLIRHWEPEEAEPRLRGLLEGERGEQGEDGAVHARGEDVHPTSPWALQGPSEGQL